MYAPCKCCENENTCLPDNSGCSLEELNSRIAVRFFMKKSKRFDLRKQQMQQKLQQLQQAAKKPESSPSPECLLYLGLAPNSKTRDRDERKEDEVPDFDFPKPMVYECCYCTKVFFHKIYYRRHVMHHIKKVHRCIRCNRGFTSKMSWKRHEVACRR